MVKRKEPTAKKAAPKRSTQGGKIHALRLKLKQKIRNSYVEKFKAGSEAKETREAELKAKAKENTLKAMVKSGSPVVLSPLAAPGASGQPTQPLVPVDTALSRSKLQKQHARTAWYMTAVEDVSPNGPTATGSLPKEYQLHKYFVPSPNSPDAIQNLPRKFQIIAAGLNTLNHLEQKRAESLLGVQMPPPNRIFAKAPRIHYFKSARLKDYSPFKKFKLHRAEQQAFTKPKLAVTAFSLNQIPRLRHHTRDVEIVFVGRSNVGKSSLINALTCSNLAKSGRTPGKTQSLNFYALHPEAFRRHRLTAASLARSSQIDTDRIFHFVQKLDPALTIPATETQQRTINDSFRRAGNGPVMFLVDVPGYGHADAPNWIVDKWNVMLGSYLRLRSPLNFPLDDISHWTTKEYLQLLVELKKNRSRPRKTRRAKIAFKHQTGTAQDAGNELSDDNDDDDDFAQDDDDAHDGNQMSDYENDSMVLFEHALNTHIQSVKQNIEKRVANTKYIMEQLKKLEDLEEALVNGDSSVDIDMIRIQRDALIDLQLRLNNSISSNPLDSTVTILPTNDVDAVHRNDEDNAIAMKDENDLPTQFAHNRSLLRRPVAGKRIVPKYNLRAGAGAAPKTVDNADFQNVNDIVELNQPQGLQIQPKQRQSDEEIDQSDQDLYSSGDGDEEYDRNEENSTAEDEYSFPDEKSENNDDQIEETLRLDPLDSYARYKTLQRELHTDLKPIHARLPPLDHLGEFHGSPLKNVVVLLDGRAGVSKYDLQFLNFLEKYHITHQVVLTKIDQMTTEQLEGSAYSVAQSLFPHEYVKVLQKTQPLQLAAFPEGKLPKDSPSFTIRTPEQDKLWVLSRKYQPRKYLSPLLIGVSANSNINLETLRKSILQNVLDRM